MDSHFKDPIKIKKQHPADHPKDGNKTPWESRMPHYDERSSCFVNVGQHYGVGHKQPVGKDHASNTGAIPYSRHPTMQVDEIG